MSRAETRFEIPSCMSLNYQRFRVWIKRVCRDRLCASRLCGERHIVALDRNPAISPHLVGNSAKLV